MSEMQMKYEAWKGEIPFYDTADGTVVEDGQFTAEMYRTRVTETTRGEYDTYCAKLVGNGFTLYADNTINGSHYATYTGKRAMAHVYYADDKKEVRILHASMEKFVAYPLAPISDGTKVTDPAATLMSMDYTGGSQGANGAGFIYTMADGSFVIIDGGWSYDTETFYQWLKANNKRADGKILIRAWMITHFHEDHYGNFESFAQKYADEVTLEYFVVQLDNPEKPLAPRDCERINTAYTCFKGATYLVPQVGQVMYFGEARFEFLHTQERLYPDYRMTDGNDYSLLAKVTFADKVFLMTGDTYPQPRSSDLVAVYGDYLKCDIVQAPHHGMGGTSNAFYDKADADIIFVNTSAPALAERLVSDNMSNYGSLQYVIKTKGTKYYVADNGYQTIPLD